MVLEWHCSLPLSLFYLNWLFITATSNNSHDAQITGQSSICSTVCSDWQQRNRKTSVSLSLSKGNPPVTVSLHKGIVMRKMFPFDDVIMSSSIKCCNLSVWLCPTILPLKVCHTLCCATNTWNIMQSTEYDFAYCMTDQILKISWTLTHLPLVPHICVSESGEHWFR